MARVPNVTRESIPESQRATFDEIVQERGEIPTVGPGSVMFNAPEVAKRALAQDHHLLCAQTVNQPNRGSYTCLLYTSDAADE